MGQHPGDIDMGPITNNTTVSVDDLRRVIFDEYDRGSRPVDARERSATRAALDHLGIAHD